MSSDAETTKARLVLGIMSGTSMDGVDYALCLINRSECKLVEHWSAAFPGKLRERLMAAAGNRASSHEVAQLHHDLGRFYARHAPRSKRKPELVGLHGQTIFHNPRQPNPATFQIGEAAYLAEQLNVPVVSNFRAADLAAGGEGAPLATAFHLMIFGEKGRHVCVNNIGGISNVTSIDFSPAAKGHSIRSFDTGPGNVLIDRAMGQLTKGANQMDRNGRWARKGKPNEQLLAFWLRHPFFRKRPPKSTGREMFGEQFLTDATAAIRKRRMTSFDIVRTLTEFTARSIALNYSLHLTTLPSLVVLTGGGASNPVLVEALERELKGRDPNIRVTDSRAYGWPLQIIEPAAFALLGYLREAGRAGNIAETTGARRSVALGQLSYPRLNGSRG
jgi:anhydro-N-acetylmuramic acid kinase